MLTQYLEAADYFGIVAANTEKDKFVNSGLHAVKSTRVDSSVREEFTLTLECEVAEIQPDGFRVVWKIVNVLADEKVLTDKGTVDHTQLNAFVFDQFQGGYYKSGEEVCQVWNGGKKLVK